MRAAHREPEACIQATKALCNTCGRLTAAKIVLRGGKVYLAKWCAEHGLTEALVSSDEGWYLRSLGYVKPGTEPLRRSVAEHRGCPDSCGLCPRHEQHTCVPILEITDRCDMGCPACLVHGRVQGDVSLDQVRSILDRLVACEGRINMLTLSGGEPTSHPELLSIVDAALRPEIGVVSVSTNGLALAADDDLIKALRDRGVVISLQYDGEKPGTYAALRGRPELAEIKARLVERVLALGGRLSLTMTLARGVNEDEVGGVMRLLLGNDGVVSVMVQPLSHAGRAMAGIRHDPLDVVTVPDAVRLLAAASGGVIEEKHFCPLPCSHPTCFALTYLLRLEGGRMIPVPALVDPETYLDVIKNQALVGTDPDSLMRIRDGLYALWTSSGAIPERDAVLKVIRQLLLDVDRASRAGNHREVLGVGAAHVKSVFIHHFMDRYTFDLSRAAKCCNHYPQVGGRLVPACVRNNLQPRI
ncbi:MAG: radical SAM protein [Deltaproteobacteria bacterium]|nr:radical SAM protein [Deltaproteobacteria bacterium]